MATPVKWPPSGSTVGTGTPSWVTATGYVLGDRVLDAAIDVYFTCILAHTSASTPPSEDPTRWRGDDDHKLGWLLPMAHKQNAGPTVACAAGVTLNRTKFVRLHNKINPALTAGITSGSNVLRVAGADLSKINLGMALEGAGIPLGTTIASAPGVSGTKTGAVTTGVPRIFLPVGQNPTSVTAPAEVDGPNITADATVTVVAPELAVASSNTVTASPNVFLPTSAVIGPYVAGSYVSSANTPAGARAITSVASFQESNSHTVNASNVLHLEAVAGPDLVKMLTGELISGTGIPALTTVVSVGAKFTLPVVNFATASVTIQIPPGVSTVNTNLQRTINSSGIPVGSFISAQGADITRVGAVDNAGVTWFAQTGQGAGLASLQFITGTDIPADDFFTAAPIAEVTAVAVTTTTGVANVFFGTGAAANGVVGQYTTLAAGGVTQSRITAVVAQFTQLLNRVVTGTSNLWLQPGTALASMTNGQFISGTSIPAAARLLSAAGTDFASNVNTLNASTLVGIPVGVSSAQFPVNRFMTCTGFSPGSANFISALQAEQTATADVTTLSTSVPLQSGSGAVANWVNRYLTATGIAAPSRITAVVIDFTRTVTRTVTGISRLFMDVGQSTAGIVPGTYVTLAGGYTNGKVASTPVAEFTSLNSTTGAASPTLNIQPGVPSASLTIGQRATGTNIPSATTIAGIVNNDLAFTLARTTNASTRLNLPVGTSATPYAVNRKVTGTNIAANSNIAGITTAEGTTAGNQLVRGGSTAVNLTPGIAPAATWVDRFISDSGGQIPTNAAVTAVTVEAATPTFRVISGNAKVFFAAGASTAGATLDRAFSLAPFWSAAPFPRFNAAPVAQQVTGATSTTVNASNQLYVAPGLIAANLTVGQGITGTNIPAATTLTVVGTDTAIVKANTRAATSSLFLPTGSSTTEYTANRKITLTGLAANTSLTGAVTVESTQQMAFTTGVATAFFPVSATPPADGRFLESLANIPVDTFIGAVSAAGSLLATTTTLTGAPNIYMAGGIASPAGAVVGAYVSAGGIGNARIASLVTTAATTATSRTTNASTTVPLSPNFSNAQVLAGRGISGTGIPASARIASITAPQVTLTNVNFGAGVSTINCPNGTVGVGVGAVVLGTGIAANTTVTGTAANTISISVPTASAQSGISIGAGAVVVISSAATATSAGVSLTLAAYVVADANSTAGATGNLDMGPQAGISTPATGTGVDVATKIGPVVTLSANATSGGNAAAGTLGAVHTMSANATAAATTTAVTFAPWVTVDLTPAAGQTGAAGTYGGILTISSAPSADASGAGETLTLGTQMTLSANATATGNLVNGQLGTTLTLSANATAAATTTTVTFGGWMDMTTAPIGTASATATFGGNLTISAAATASTAATLLTIGQQLTMGVAATATAPDTAALFGAQHVMSANATATTASLTVTFGRWITQPTLATVSGATTGIFGAMATLNAAATAANVGGTFTLGRSLTLSGASTTAAHNLQAATLGPELVMSANATATASSLLVTFGGYVVLDGNATATGSITATLGGNYTLDTNATATGAGGSYVFGSNVTMSSNATATNETAAVRAFAYGTGDGSLTFNIPGDVAGRALAFAGAGAGLTARAVGLRTGAESVTLSAAESGQPGFTPSITDAIVINDPGHNHGGSVGGQSAWRYLPGTDTAGRIQNNYTGGYFPAEAPAVITIPSGTASVTRSGGVTANATPSAPASTAHSNMPPVAMDAIGMAMYAGAA